jgi:glycosyltransferase involved in cell wall biosynthesis
MTSDDAHTVVRPSIGLGEEQLSDNRLTRARPPKVTILVCALNEEATIAEVLSRIPSWVEEVLLVDGGSNDRTIEMAKSSHDKVRVLSQPGEGKGNAIRFGVSQSRGDIIVTVDADGQTDPEEIHRFVEALLAGNDVAKGSRLAGGKPEHMSTRRWIGNKLLVTTFNVLYGTCFTDICSGYNGFWKDTFLRVAASLEGFEFEQQILARFVKTGSKVAEVSHRDYGRAGGVSKTIDLRQGTIDWWVIVKERFAKDLEGRL